MKCPKCKSELEGIMSVGPLAPLEGDVTLCIDCGDASIFIIDDKGELGLRLPESLKEFFECEIAVATLLAYAREKRSKQDTNIN